MKKISVVTVTFNCKDVIEETILSVINQTYNDKEYIVVDGGSNDGTLNIISEYRQHIDILVSEPDNGIFDAMNKAIDYANGEYVIFINAGDRFVNRDVLLSVFSKIKSGPDLIYGDTYIQTEFGFNLSKANAIYPQNPTNRELVFKSQGICHQSLFTRTELLKKIRFDINYKIGADYDTTYKVYMQGNHKLYYIGFPIAIFDDRTGGASHYKIIQMYRERFAMFGYSPNYLDLLHMYYEYFTIYMKQFVEALFPIVVKKYRAKKYIKDI